MKKVINVLILFLLSVPAYSVHAATINGSFGITGELAPTGGPTGGSDLSNITDISLFDVFGTGISDGDTATVTFFSSGTGGASVSLTGAPLPAGSFFTIEGWSFELSTLNIVDRASDLLSLKGTGVLTGNGFEATSATWTFSSRSMTGYDMSITAVPVPAAVWLFGSGLIGLVAVSRRKA